MTTVVQWATGNIGGRALREVIRDPGLELAGVYVTNPAKDSVDAGTLCGEPAAGVAATTDKAKILALQADCCVYMPLLNDLSDVLALLSSGTNVVTTRGEYMAGGAKLSPEDRAAVLAACEQGGTSVYATGSSPGFITDALPFALLSLSRRVDRIEISEYANMSRRDSPQLIFDVMGYGRPLSTFDARRGEFLLGEFGPSLDVLSRAAGRPVDSWSASGEVAAATRDIEIEAGTIAAGTIAAQRMTMIGSSGGTEAIRFVTNWYCTEDLDPGWDDLLTAGWRVRVEGDTPVDVAITFPVELDVLNDYTPGLTAHRPVNAIRHVVAARPGILGTRDLPQFVPGE